MTPARQRMLEDMRLWNYSPQTQEAYVRAVARFANHFMRPPQPPGKTPRAAFTIASSMMVTRDMATCAARHGSGVFRSSHSGKGSVFVPSALRLTLPTLTHHIDRSSRPGESATLSLPEEER